MKQEQILSLIKDKLKEAKTKFVLAEYNSKEYCHNGAIIDILTELKYTIQEYEIDCE